MRSSIAVILAGCLAWLSAVPALAIPVTPRFEFGDEGASSARSGFSSGEAALPKDEIALPRTSAALWKMGAVPAAPASIPLIDELSVLSPVMRVERLQELAASNASARNLGAAVVAPGVIGVNRAGLESRLGPENLETLTRFVIDLHIEARGDERVMKALENLTRQIAPDGQAAPLDLSQWYDGGAKAAPAPDAAAPAPRNSEPSAAPRLFPTQAWPIEEGGPFEKRVHAIAVQNGQIYIDGKAARVFQEGRSEEGATKAAFYHPNDNNLLVKIFSSPTMDGFERKAARVEGLSALSAAGAAPKLLEHGETPVDGLGRVYYYVQELVKGIALKEIPSEKRPMAEVVRLFERLAQAGLSVVLPGADRDWLLSHIMIGQTSEGVEKAYLVGVSAERTAPEDVAAHNETLLSVLRPSDEESAAAGAQPVPVAAPLAAPAVLGETPSAPAVGAKLVLIEDKADLEKDPRWFSFVSVDRMKRNQMDRRHGFKGEDHCISNADCPEERWVFDSDEQAALMAAKLLADPDVMQVKIHPRLKNYIERGSVKALHGMLELLPGSAVRDALLLKIPGAAYVKSQSADIAPLLELASREKAKDIYPKVAKQAWEKMSQEDAESFIKRRLAVGDQETAGAIVPLWMNAHYDHFYDSDGNGGIKALYDLLRLFPRSFQRDLLILNYANSRTTPRDMMKVLVLLAQLVSPEGQKNPEAIFGNVHWSELGGHSNVGELIDEMSQVAGVSLGEAVRLIHQRATQRRGVWPGPR